MWSRRLRHSSSSERARDLAGPDLGSLRQARLALTESVLLESQDRRRQLLVLLDAVEPARLSGDPSLEAEVLAAAAEWLSAAGRQEESLRYGQEALSLARSLDEPVLLGRTLFHFATALVESEPADAEAMFKEALGLIRETGDIHTASKAHNNLCIALMMQGKLTEARQSMMEAISQFQSTSSYLSGMAIHNLASIDLEEGNVEQAAAGFAESLRIDQLCGAVMLSPVSVACLARCAALQGDLLRAAVLSGGADSLLALAADRWAWGGEQEHDNNIEELRSQLGEEFEGAYAAGRAMAAEEIVRLALNGQTADTTM